MHHTTERQRLLDGKLGWFCITCKQWWTREPSSYCPGVRAYWSWDEVQAAGFRTTTQWKKEHRKPTSGARPTAVKIRSHAYPSEWFDLYTEDQTIPMRGKVKV